MNVMFAIELALKSIHVKSEPKAWGRKIRPPLDSLPSNHNAYKKVNDEKIFVKFYCVSNRRVKIF